MACPFTIVLNVLVVMAVKMKARLQSLSNIGLAFLAVTDVMAVGILVQPPHISVMITTLQGDITSVVCRLYNVSRSPANFFCPLSLFHLVLIIVDRFLAIKLSFNYNQIVTKPRWRLLRPLRGSSLQWYTSFYFLTITYLFLFKFCSKLHFSCYSFFAV